MPVITEALENSSAEVFNEWLERMGYNQIKAAEELGLTPSTIYSYAGSKSSIPKCVILACEALEIRRKQSIRQYALRIGL